MCNTQKAIDSTGRYRNLPDIKKGMACEVDGRLGMVVGGNTAANLNVKFDGVVANCHPYWRMKILDFDGNVFYESKEPM